MSPSRLSNSHLQFRLAGVCRGRKFATIQVLFLLEALVYSAKKYSWLTIHELLLFKRRRLADVCLCLVCVHPVVSNFHAE